MILSLFLCLCLSSNLKAAEADNNDSENSDEVVNKAVAKKVYKQLNVTSYEKLVPAKSYQKYTSVQPVGLLKAGRFKFNVGADVVQNETYFSSYGALLGVQYFFDETWGLGFTGTAYSSTQNSQTSNFKDVQAVNTDLIPSLKNKLQADLYFVPFYGKWSLGGQTIIPFELYLKAGACQVKNQFNDSSNGYELGLGQIVTLNENSSVDVALQLSSYKEAGTWAQDKVKNSVSFLVSYSFFLPNRTKGE